MKKMLTVFLALLIVLPLCGEAAAQAQEGTLFFTVSKIVFSVQGESEDIYIGTVPREEITWESDDPSVARFRDGVLTATGVGSTTVRAVWGEQSLECQVECLADSRAKLESLSQEVLRSPKRYPPVVEDTTHDFFRNSAIIGDSISYIMYQYETQSGLLGHPLFLVRGGTSLNGFVVHYKNIFYQGAEIWLEDAVGASGVEKVFIMLGQNDLGYRSIDETFDSWDILLSRFWEKSPDLEVYIQSCVPEWTETYSPNSKNEKIQDYNLRLKPYALEKGCHFIDIASYIEDHTGRMATVYSMDRGIHLNQEGCEIWMQALNAYAYWVSIGGEDL